jgi:hypothetical protein
VIIESEEEEDTEKLASDEEKSRKTTPQDYVDTTLLPFPPKNQEAYHG